MGCSGSVFGPTKQFISYLDTSNQPRLENMGQVEKGCTLNVSAVLPGPLSCCQDHLTDAEKELLFAFLV